ncbi:acetyl-CoA carboxylase biotin carboxylase subunit [Geobacter sulfurreducens]|jgi:acetyl-CoA carboxylase biotin carboxylase subunit|uniref:Biotin carboxylase n=1 Tax=Geobacter sulfurreducens (strain ATCC 51573 / DSM 12127 / PCA) TaxID=243231 RepID=Q74BM2_GEOSL|nr:acetyl-CoA carboxylase biotin carboxylase subunit [Geobacter sulfurreducens]AAR35395.1 acetyl-CoA carboxylase, biotin carboxylase component [Geobacter sulfurreducens PCA]ADI84853.1 acetyl-CoA carboxylase, biotin carboxylase component [Geobacter sulfurreducens KN400]AJY68250.1 acetyl-CoA carboxylase [Geobacter sulfurreducens]QVW33961.1 acetyl-CoA carboxylase biotin carboxylase subunit [Geobacter sulfurreducens]UAC02751.1 acetyl-CoA carboxylase biotin carboxylase subunit [Geobacter sulfurredu
MFHKVLIANRGEIALRVIRACKELGIKTVAVYSTADRDSLHVKLADESVCIGPAPSLQSYLNINAIISAAELTDAEAIHPGYGFLSENAAFAEICENCGITFIGPSSQSMRIMGDKISARQAVIKENVPILPGTKEGVNDVNEAVKIAKKIGFPVIIKATAGGGGRGMKIVHSPAALPNAFATARAEAQAGFGNPEVYIEKYCEKPRHVEIQVMADKHGNVIHLGERDCSIQRRHQKIIEESPCPVMTPALRKAMGDAAVRASKAVGYDSVGTVEFLVDKDLNFYFMEMNTRVQVEHPVTEMVTGIDIVREQIRSAAGLKLRYKQSDIKLHGHAIECRINAEDPVKFTPSPGKIVGYHTPGGLGVRIDSFVYDQYSVVPHYDSLIAKLIVHAETREDAIRRMARALDEYIIEGIKTTIPFHKRIMDNKDFMEGNVDTGFLERIVLE